MKSLNELIRDVINSADDTGCDGLTCVDINAFNALKNYMSSYPDEPNTLHQEGCEAGNDFKLPGESSAWVELDRPGYVVHIVNGMPGGTFVEVMFTEDADNDEESLGRIDIPEVD